MKESYRNDVDIEYKKSEKNEKILNILFIVILIISVFNIYNSLEFLIYLLIILNSSYIFLSLFDDIIIKNNAELERRKTLISDAFSINLTSKKTVGYYNNNFSPSIKKLGSDSFESILYTKKNLSMMLLTEGIKTFVIFMIWLIIITKFNNTDLLYNLTQTFFSFEILLRFIKLVYYYSCVSKLYDNFYELYITKGYKEKRDQAIVLEYVMNYECLKNYCHILLSSKNFDKINDDLSCEWEKMKQDIR